MRKFLNKMTGGGTADSALVEDPARTEDVIHVVRGKDNYQFTFPLGAISNGAVTVGELRAKVALEIGVEPERTTLVGLGRNMRDDAATLRSLGMGSGTKILCMASQVKATGLATKKATPAKTKPLGLMEAIEAVKQAVVDKTGQLTADFVENPPAEQKDREDVHRRITETIMGELLKLDGIESDDPAVRIRRKEVVKEIQRMLESVDAVLKKAEAPL